MRTEECDLGERSGAREENGHKFLPVLRSLPPGGLVFLPAMYDNRGSMVRSYLLLFLRVVIPGVYGQTTGGVRPDVFGQEGDGIGDFRAARL